MPAFDIWCHVAPLFVEAFEESRGHVSLEGDEALLVVFVVTGEPLLLRFGVEGLEPHVCAERVEASASEEDGAVFLVGKTHVLPCVRVGVVETLARHFVVGGGVFDGQQERVEHVQPVDAEVSVGGAFHALAGQRQGEDRVLVAVVPADAHDVAGVAAVLEVVVGVHLIGVGTEDDTLARIEGAHLLDDGEHLLVGGVLEVLDRVEDGVGIRRPQRRNVVVHVDAFDEREMGRLVDMGVELLPVLGYLVEHRNDVLRVVGGFAVVVVAEAGEDGPLDQRVHGFQPEGVLEVNGHFLSPLETEGKEFDECHGFVSWLG